jgi:hypothetical protein
MKANLLEELKTGKRIRVKHPEYAFTIHAELKLENENQDPAVKVVAINLPTKAGKGEKLLLKLAHIYCFDVLCENLLNDVVNSREYLKLIGRIRNELVSRR